MSATIQARGVGAGHGSTTLFSGLDLVVAPGDVIGLVGPNGAGKTTILRILAGERAPDAGSVTRSPADARVGYLRQELEHAPQETIREAIARRTGVADAERAMNVAAEALADGGDADEYAARLEDWMALGGADLDERLPKVAAEVELDLDLDRPVASLSGGQRARVGLAGLLASRYDAYLLDEPTNDLDVDGLDLLEDFVDGLDAPVVLVSHDREFLSRTVNSVLEIDRSLLKVALYGGGYEAYLEERSLARQHARESFEQYAQRKADLQARARMQRAWMDKGTKKAVRAGRKRSGFEKDKNILAHAKSTSEKQAAKAKQTEKMIERLEVVDEPRKEWQLQMTIAAAPRSGDVVATANHAVVHRGSFTLGPVDLQLDVRDRVAITGPNGGGKSTLLALLLGRLRPDDGTASLGSGVVVGEVDQARGRFEGDEPLGIAFEREVPDWPSAEARTLLAKFGLKGDHVSRTASSLSPGERTRAALALLQARGVNLLVLDEPTNHLDLPAIEQLEQAMDSFEGTILLVTHDRRMLDTVRLTRRWHVEDGQVREIPHD